MPLTDEQRQHIVEVAKGWYGTPYRPCTCAKGIGADCGTLLKGVFLEAGHRADGVPLPEFYSVTTGMHRRATDYLDFLEKYFQEIPESEVKPGDVVVYQLGQGEVSKREGFMHAAIIVDWPAHMIHSLAREGVHAGHGMNFRFSKLNRKFFTLKDEHC